MSIDRRQIANPLQYELIKVFICDCLTDHCKSWLGCERYIFHNYAGCFEYGACRGYCAVADTVNMVAAAYKSLQQKVTCKFIHI